MQFSRKLTGTTLRINGIFSQSFFVFRGARSSAKHRSAIMAQQSMGNNIIATVSVSVDMKISGHELESDENITGE